MWRDYASINNGFEEFFRKVLKDGERVGIQHHRLARAERRKRVGAGFAGHPVAGADQHGVLARIRQKIREILICLKRRRDHARAGKGIDRQCLGPTGQGHQTGPNAQGGAGGQAGGAGHGGPAQHQGVPETVLVIVQRPTRKARQPKLWIVFRRVRGDFLEDLLRNADVGDDDLAAQQAPRQKQVSGLLPKKSDGKRRRRRDGALRRAQDHAPIAREAARHVDGDQRQPTPGDFPQQIAGGAVHGPSEPGAEKRIDDQRGALEQRRRELLHLAPPKRGMVRGLAPKPIARAEQP